ncbi:hypothetical protein O6H91_10G052200 [Diphasiastrum complanatum]|nr:hypothetical protein O6H91_10G052200 [Diphasiastrum complanatum]
MLRGANQSVDKCFWRKVHQHGGTWRESRNNVEVQQEECPILGSWDDAGRRVHEEGSPSNSWYKSTPVGGWTLSHTSAYRSSWDMEQEAHETLLTPTLKGIQLKSELVGGRRSEASPDQCSGIFSMEDHSSYLPDDMLEKIFAMLPLLSLFRSTVVCKRWRRIISSESFIMVACALSRPHKPWYLMYRDSEHSFGVSYDPSSKKWHQFALPSFDPLASFAASANGLACFMDKTNCDVIYVCNPMTKMWRKLPKPSSPWISDYSAVDMAVDRENHMYKVVVARSTPVPGDYSQWDLSVEVYDSVSDCWNTSNTMLLQGRRAGEESKICKGILYCVSHSTSTVAVGHEESRHGLIAYDLSLGKFHDIISMPCSLSCARLVSCRGKLIMVGGIGAYDFIKGVGIWVLDKEWKQIGRMPTKLFHGFVGGLDDVFSCGGHGELIYIHSYGSPQLLVYDLASGSWNWARTCPVLKRDPLHLFTGFCFEPRLNVTV